MTSMMVAVVSLEDHDTSFQTVQTAALVSTVLVRVAHPVRGQIKSIRSANRILRSP